MLIWTLLLGCQEPFGTDRHRLEGDRIASVSVHMDAEGALQPRATVVVDGQLWSAPPPAMVWAWVLADESVQDWTGQPAASGPTPWLIPPDASSRLLLMVDFPSGDLRQALWTPPAEPAWRSIPLGVSGQRVEPGETLQFSADTSEVVRWSATDGQFSELERSITEWTATGDDSTALMPGFVSVLGITLDPVHGPQGRLEDVAIGDSAPGAWVDGRFLPGAIEGWQMGTLSADDTSTSGLSLDAVTPLQSEPADDPSDPFGTADLPCSDGGPFSPSWTALGCHRGDFVGHIVTVFGTGQTP